MLKKSPGIGSPFGFPLPTVILSNLPRAFRLIGMWKVVFKRCRCQRAKQHHEYCTMRNGSLVVSLRYVAYARGRVPPSKFSAEQTPMKPNRSWLRISDSPVKAWYKEAQQKPPSDDPWCRSSGQLSSRRARFVFFSTSTSDRNIRRSSTGEDFSPTFMRHTVYISSYTSYLIHCISHKCSSRPSALWVPCISDVQYV